MESKKRRRRENVFAHIKVEIPFWHIESAKLKQEATGDGEVPSKKGRKKNCLRRKFFWKENLFPQQKKRKILSVTRARTISFHIADNFIKSPTKSLFWTAAAKWPPLHFYYSQLLACGLSILLGKCRNLNVNRICHSQTNKTEAQNEAKEQQQQTHIVMMKITLSSV